MDERAGPLGGVLSWKVYALLAAPWLALGIWFAFFAPGWQHNPTLTAVCLSSGGVLAVIAVIAAVRHHDARSGPSRPASRS